MRQEDKTAPAAVPVTVAAAQRRTVPFELAAPGMVEPLQTVAVQPQVSGLIEHISFTEGQEVRKGQVLFQIDARPFQAALGQAQAALARDSAQAANAEQDVTRYAALAQKEYVTAQQYDQARDHRGGSDGDARRKQGGRGSGATQPAVRHYPRADRREDGKPPSPRGNLVRSRRTTRPS